MCFFAVAVLSSAVLADPRGGGNSGINNINNSSIPPGLSGRGTPHGLSMQNKTPYGWSQGRKMGWKKHSHHGRRY